MKRKIILRTMLILGIIPFAIPFLAFAYEVLNSSSWALFDFLIFYSFLYWPTYILGLVLAVVSICMLKK